MPEMQFHCMIKRPTEAVFQLITDLSNYDKWLPPSDVFIGTSTISDNPIKNGTTYLDRGPSAVLRGKVTTLIPPTQVSFYQATRFKKLGLSGEIAISASYALEPLENGTQVTRNISLTLAGILKLLQPVLLRRIRQENERILQMLKTYLESQS